MRATASNPRDPREDYALDYLLPTGRMAAAGIALKKCGAFRLNEDDRGYAIGGSRFSFRTEFLDGEYRHEGGPLEYGNYVQMRESLDELLEIEERAEDAEPPLT